MKIEITDRQRAGMVDRAAIRRLAGWLMDKAGAMDPSRRWIELSIVLLDDHEIAALNMSALGHAGSTDVITFTYPSMPGEQAGFRGEVVINAALAMASGRTRRGGPDRELALYLAHGCQHLGGADDRTEPERKAMARRQNRWLREAAALGYVQNLWRSR